MQVSGEDAKRWNAVRLDNFQNANQGELVSADDQTGAVSWKDKTGAVKNITLGLHAIRLILAK